MRKRFRTLTHSQTQRPIPMRILKLKLKLIHSLMRLHFPTPTHWLKVITMHYR
jgi:hypothetical protein